MPVGLAGFSTGACRFLAEALDVLKASLRSDEERMMKARMRSKQGDEVAAVAVASASVEEDETPTTH